MKTTKQTWQLIGAILSLVPASLAWGVEQNQPEIAPDRIAFFSVPLRCPAAPQIGCGNASKPILLKLQREPTIAEAWLNETGTVLAVVWTNSADHDSGTKALQAVLEKDGLSVAELEGAARDAELKSFVSSTDWYHGADVDKLTEHEATIIAARLVRRVQTKIALSEEKAEALQAKFSDVMARFALAGLSPYDWAVASREELLKIAHENLNQNEVEALREAIAKGFLPVADEKEETKSGIPNCCSR